MSTISSKSLILLSFVNRILTNLGRPSITILTDFKEIDRDDIIKDINTLLIDELSSEIFKEFSKIKCDWYSRKKIKNYIMSLLRYMCVDVGLKFVYIKKDISTRIGDKTYRSTHYFYSIVSV